MVPPTNTARAFRTERDAPGRSGLCREHASQCDTINDDGRAALREFLPDRAEEHTTEAMTCAGSTTDRISVQGL